MVDDITGINPDLLWRRKYIVDPVPWPWFKDLENPIYKEILVSYIEFEKAGLAAQAEFDKVMVTARREMLDRVGTSVRKFGSRVAPK